MFDKEVDEATLEELEAWGFMGIDVSLEISLFEYGLICYYDESKSEWFCVFGVEQSGGHYTVFSTGFVEVEEVEELVDESFLRYSGMEREDWMNLHDVQKIHDMVNYQSYLNVFGVATHKFQMISEAV